MAGETTFFDGFGEQKVLAERARKDINGESLELTISEGQVTAIGGKPVAGSGGSGLPVSETGNSILFTETPNGEASWVQMDSTVFVMDDEDSNHILDESDNPLLNEDSVSLWSGLDGKGFLAERAVADGNGNIISETYAKKSEQPSGSSVSISYDSVEAEIHFDFSGGNGQGA